MDKPQKKKRKPTHRKRPKMLELDDHDLMETIFGKKVTKKLDKIASESLK